MLEVEHNTLVVDGNGLSQKEKNSEFDALKNNHLFTRMESIIYGINNDKNIYQQKIVKDRIKMRQIKYSKLVTDLEDVNKKLKLIK